MNQNQARPVRPSNTRRPVARRSRPEPKKERKPIKHFYLKSFGILIAGGLIVFGVIKYFHHNSSRSNLAKAEDYLERGNTSYAIKYVQNALYFDNEYVDAFVVKARIHLIWEDYYDCLHSVNMAIKYSDDTTTEMHYLMGVSMYKEGLFGGSLPHLLKVYDEQPEKDSLGCFIGNIYHNTELNYKEALKYYLPYFDNNRSDVKAALNISNCFYKMENFKKAIEHYQIVLKIDDKNLEALTGIAKCYFKKEDTKELGCESATLASKYGSEDAQILFELNCQIPSDTLNPEE